mgnify:CR=1 FL=1
MATYFGNLAGVPGISWEDLIRALVRLTGPRPAWVLMGNRWVERTASLFDRPVSLCPCTYAGGRDCTLMAFAPALVRTPAGLTWQTALDGGLATLPSRSTVLDPFAGMGSIAALCQVQTLNYLGLELSAERAARSGLAPAAPSQRPAQPPQGAGRSKLQPKSVNPAAGCPGPAAPRRSPGPRLPGERQ